MRTDSQAAGSDGLVDVKTLREKIRALPTNDPARAAGYRILEGAYTEKVEVVQRAYPVYGTVKYESMTFGVFCREEQVSTEWRTEQRRTRGPAETLDWQKVNGSIEKAIDWTESATPAQIEALAAKSVMSSLSPDEKLAYSAIRNAEGGEALAKLERSVRGLNSFKNTIGAFAQIAEQYAQTDAGKDALTYYFVARMSQSIDQAQSMHEQERDIFGTDDAHRAAPESSWFQSKPNDQRILRLINESNLPGVPSFTTLSGFVTWARTQKNEIVNDALGNLVDRFGASSVGA